MASEETQVVDKTSLIETEELQETPVKEKEDFEEHSSDQSVTKPVNKLSSRLDSDVNTYEKLETQDLEKTTLINTEEIPTKEDRKEPKCDQSNTKPENGLSSSINSESNVNFGLSTKNDIIKIEKFPIKKEDLAEHENDQEDMKPTNGLLLSNYLESDVNFNQSTNNDSFTLMIATQFLEVILNNVEEENTESPLNLSMAKEINLVTAEESNEMDRKEEHKNEERPFYPTVPKETEVEEGANIEEKKNEDKLSENPINLSKDEAETQETVEELKEKQEDKKDEHAIVDSPLLSSMENEVVCDLFEEDPTNEKEGALDLSIGEDLDDLLQNCCDEHEATEKSQAEEKDEDVNTASSNPIASSDNIMTNDHDSQSSDEKDNSQEEQITNVKDTVAESSQTEDPVSTSNEVSSTSASVIPVLPINQISKKTNPKNDNIEEKKTKNIHGRNLWVTNLLLGTRAQELKHLFSQCGKVIGAKVVHSSSFPRQRWCGYVTMESSAVADLCVEKLNNTELKGHIIRVTTVRPEHNLPIKFQKKSTPAKKDEKKPVPLEKNPPYQSGFKKGDTNKDKKKEEPASRSIAKRNLSNFSGYRSNLKTQNYEKFRKERERRQRDHERAMREEEKHHRHMQRIKDIEKRQREEEMRLEREREKLRIERERIDRLRADIMRLEREKLEQEKQELRRQQIRLEEARRPIKRSSSPSVSSYKRIDDRKDKKRHFDESPPSPRFKVKKQIPKIETKKELPKNYKPSINYSKHSEDEYKNEFKRDYPSAYIDRMKERDIREPVRREVVIPSSRSRSSKEIRYDKPSRSRSPVPYRSFKDDRQRKPVLERLELHTKKSIQPSRDLRYSETTRKEESRYQDTPWHASSSTAVKPFSSVTSSTSSSRETWGYNLQPIEPRWDNSSSHLVMPSSSSSVPPNVIYPGVIGQGMIYPQQQVNNNYSVNRFDKFKSVNTSRKY